ncbi:DNA repair protein Rad4 [Ostertagia ostertagi]
MPRNNRLSMDEQAEIDVMRDLGWSVRRMSQRIDRSRDCIARYLRNPLAYNTKTLTGRPKKLSERDRRSILRLASNSTKTASEIREELGLQVSKDTVIRVINDSTSKDAGPAVRKEGVEAKGSSLGKRSLPLVKAPVEGKKPRVGTKSPATRAKPGKRNLETPDSEEVRKDEEVVADSANSSKEAPKLDVEKDLLHEEGKVAEQMKQEETHDQSFGDSKSANDEKQDTAQKSTPKQDDDDWENFGNTSDEEESIAASEPVKKKKKVKPKTTASKPLKKSIHSDPFVRRSGRNVVRKSYVVKDDDGEDSLSSSPSASDSESEGVGQRQLRQSSDNPRVQPDTETEASSVAEDPDDSDASFTPSKAQQPKRGSGGKGGGSSRPQARNPFVRRSGRNVVRKSYVVKDDDGEDSLSSSPSASDSESEGVGLATTSTEPDTETEASSVAEDPDDSDASFTPSKAQQPKRGSGGKGGGSSRPQARSSKTEREVFLSSLLPVSNAPTKTQASRPTSSKPLKPWQKVNEPVTLGDIVVPPRALRRGERKMAKFRILAAALAVGRKLEMTQEEGDRIVDGMNSKCVSKATAVPSSENMKDPEEGASSSEDEWEDMVPADADEAKGKHVQITLNKAEEKNWWGLYLRQEVNKCVRENWENCHKMPSGYQALVGETMTVENARRIVKYFHSAFKPSGAPITFEPGLCRFDATARYSEMVSRQEFENDADRAALLFALFVSMECVARICVNTQTIPRKWDTSVLKEVAKMRKESSVPASSATASTSSKKKPKAKESSKKKGSAAGDHRGMIRNYWVEYWDKKQNKWICVDPLLASVDDPNSFEENMTKPVVYVLAIDNEGGVREVTARYAAAFSHPDFRRRRTDQNWLSSTLRKSMIRADRKRGQLEDVQLRQELVNKPLPVTLSEYKNHPLCCVKDYTNLHFDRYVLEKDLLKFEGIYPRPEDQKPLGEVRGHKEGEKAYKVVKARPNLHVPAEEREPRFLDLFGYWQTEPFRPPKVVNGRIPRNEFGNVYMYVPSMCPIGAVFLRLPGLPSIARRLGGLECVPAVVGWDFNSCTNFPILDGAVVLEEDAEKFITEYKRLQATKEERENKRREERVLGNWRKLIRGILRLHYVKSKFGATKSRAQAATMHCIKAESLRREERVLGNWRKLIRGILRLHYVKSKFGATKSKPKGKKKKGVKEETEEESCVIDRTVMGERQVFTHDDLMKLKH